MKNQHTRKTISSEFDFFIKTPLTKYEGQYVAILGRKIVSSGPSARLVWLKAKKKHPKSLPTIAKIPKKEVLVLLWN